MNEILFLALVSLMMNSSAECPSAIDRPGAKQASEHAAPRQPVRETRQCGEPRRDRPRGRDDPSGDRYDSVAMGRGHGAHH